MRIGSRSIGSTRGSGSEAIEPAVSGRGAGASAVTPPSVPARSDSGPPATGEEASVRGAAPSGPGPPAGADGAPPIPLYRSAAEEPRPHRSAELGTPERTPAAGNGSTDTARSSRAKPPHPDATAGTPA